MRWLMPKDSRHELIYIITPLCWGTYKGAINGTKPTLQTGVSSDQEIMISWLKMLYTTDCTPNSRMNCYPSSHGSKPSWYGSICKLRRKEIRILRMILCKIGSSYNSHKKLLYSMLSVVTVKALVWQVRITPLCQERVTHASELIT